MKKKDQPKIPKFEILCRARSLREYERAESLEKKAKVARELFANYEDQARRGRRDHFTEMFFVGGIANGLERSVKHIREEEKSLKRLGWKMDDEGRVTRIRKGVGADLLGEVAWELYERDHADEGITKAVLQKIADTLEPFFPPGEVSSESGASIYMAIYNRMYRRL